MRAMIREEAEQCTARHSLSYGPQLVVHLHYALVSSCSKIYFHVMYALQQ